jgi:uncharacterized protein (DUF488 family)
MPLYTLGYEKREPTEFLVILKENNIEILADIRINPISRKKGFSKNQLTQALNENGIEYVHVRELGTPQEIRDRLRADGDFERFLREYEAYLKTQSEALRRLAELASARRTCIMCFERDYKQCHRQVVAEYLTRRFKLDVTHL